ncbi:MAG: hypothetical protein IJY12_00555 [Clostridia bacterium]|nr:hypothetical protein [Clostridia bacterium]
MKNAKRMTTKALAMLIAILMVASMLPVVAFAAESDTTGYVYLSISFDKNYINDKNGSPMVFVPVALSDIAAVDLTEYGLENMLYDADGDGEYEITALQLLIYAHEELWGGDWGDVNFDALPGSSYFKGGIFGFTENLVYFLNGDFPVDESMSSEWMTTGATSDRIVLEAGDFLDVASFECYSFLWDQLGGFHLFADENGNYVHDYTAIAGEALSVKLKHSFCDLMFGASWVKDAADFEISYGSVYGEALGKVTTDDEGNAEITFPSAGTYYVWSEGGIGSDDGTHSVCDHYSSTGEPCVVSSPAYARVTVTGNTSGEITPDPEPEQPRQPQDVSTVLNATMAQLAATVTAPSFGTNAGEWTVFSLARGGYFTKDNAYFTDYYNRIVETVNEIAADVNLSGALDKNKSTENSRLIVALSAIGKDARAVGNWNLVEAYSANGINWIKKQGMNGTIWTLIALDSGNYATSDPTIRQQCIDSILEARHNDGGWSLVTAKAQPSNVDITCMTLTALYPYRDQPEVASACAEAIEWLSESQLASGGFPYGQGETSESCAWAIVALTMWGINPDTDTRFIKDGKSAVDNLLTYYVADEAMFEHGKGAGSNAMATDQATYALVAYDRFINGEKALYDYSDVTFENEETPVDPDVTDDEINATIGLPENVKNIPDTEFNAVISVDSWNNDGEYKLLEVIVDVPEGIIVEDVLASNRLVGGSLRYNLSEGKLRIVYFDANTNSDITVNGESFPMELISIKFAVDEVDSDESLTISVSNMNLKLSSDASDDDSCIEIDVEKATGNVTVVDGRVYSAKELYQGDGVDIIPADKKAIMVTVTNLGEIDDMYKLTYDDGTNTIVFKYSEELSEKMGVAAYIALVSTSVSTESFENAEYYTVKEVVSETVTFGDINGDGVINAQDALAAVDMWLRKGDAPTDDQILAANVNGDSRIDTYDALGIVEAFVYDDRVFAIISKATTVND